MFESARIKLTIWYVAIIMVICISFSLIIYQLITNEFKAYEKLYWYKKKTQLQKQFTNLPECTSEMILEPDIALQRDLTNHLKFALLLLNVGILGLSAVGSYLLAGRTLRPIQDMMEQQNRFISDASHELRTPLASIQCEIEVNLRDKNMTMAEAKEILNSNLEDVNRLNRLTENLLKLTSYEANRNKLITENVSLEEILIDAQKKVAHALQDKKITFQTTIKDTIFKADPHTLSELFVILLDNAIKYSPPESTIQITGKKRNGSIQVDIKDSGPGINAEDIPRIFDRFYRADKSRTKTNGYGLGLSIAQTIAKAHGGWITVKSSVGKGSTFTVVLPVWSTRKII